MEVDTLGSMGGSCYPESSLGVSWPYLPGCFVLQVCTQLVQPISYDGGELLFIHHMSHRHSCLQR